MLFWILIEAILITFFGTTPGKQFFDIRVVSKNKEKLSFFYSFNRSFRIFLRSRLLSLQVNFNNSNYKSYGKGSTKNQSYWDYPGVMVLSIPKNNDRFFVGIALVIGMLIIKFILAKISLTLF